MLDGFSGFDAFVFVLGHFRIGRLIGVRYSSLLPGCRGC